VAGSEAREIIEALRGVLGVDDIEQPPLEELVAAIAEDLAGALVDLEDAPLGVGEPNALAGLLDERAVTLPALAERRVEVVAILGALCDRDHGAGAAALGVVDRRSEHARPEDGAVAAANHEVTPHGRARLSQA
jgi:hypothetical protein